jgi:magnesium-dependent phosphatase 1
MVGVVHGFLSQKSFQTPKFHSGLNANKEARGRPTPSKPRLIVFDLDGCLWKPEMYELAWQGMNHSPFEPIRDGTFMKSRLDSVVRLFGDIPEILDEIVLNEQEWSGTQLAISSRTDEPQWAKELLAKFVLPKSGMTLESAIKGPWEISYDSKTIHFERIAKKTGIGLEEMVFFDNEQGNCKLVSRIGVTVGYSPDGLNHGIFQATMEAFPTAWGVVGLEI